jgi:hypothetical protein
MKYNKTKNKRELLNLVMVCITIFALHFMKDNYNIRAYMLTKAKPVNTNDQNPSGKKTDLALNSMAIKNGTGAYLWK